MVLAAGVQRHVGPFTAVGLTQFTSIQTHRRVRREYRLERSGGGFFTPPEVKKKLLSEETLSEKTVEKPADEKAYAKIAKYFTEMGIADGIMTYQRQATEGKPSILRHPELQTTQLATGFMSAIQYLRPVPPPAAAAPTPAAPAGPVMVTPDGTRIGPAPSAPTAATPSAPHATPVAAVAAGGAVPPPPSAQANPAPADEQSKPQPAAAKPQP